MVIEKFISNEVNTKFRKKRGVIELKGRLVSIVMVFLMIVAVLTPATATNIATNNTTVTTASPITTANDHQIYVNDVVKITKAFREFANIFLQTIIKIHNEDEKTQRHTIDVIEDIANGSIKSKQTDSKNSRIIIRKPSDTDNPKPIDVNIQNSNSMYMFIIFTVVLIVIVAIVAIGKR